VWFLDPIFLGKWVAISNYTTSGKAFAVPSEKKSSHKNLTAQFSESFFDTFL
jgi:hypothetical protein